MSRNTAKQWKNHDFLCLFGGKEFYVFTSRSGHTQTNERLWKRIKLKYGLGSRLRPNLIC